MVLGFFEVRELAARPKVGMKCVASRSPALFPIVPPRPQCPPGRRSRPWMPGTLAVVPTLEDLRLPEQGCGWPRLLCAMSSE